SYAPLLCEEVSIEIFIVRQAFFFKKFNFSPSPLLFRSSSSSLKALDKPFRLFYREERFCHPS
ncbi:MAG: hypothetical protein IKJ34_04765, partial [Mailhella sp.]|nr:hypothetical protein [Mailhella sp.]